MAEATFERSVFINCPFDSDYSAILQAILFCIVDLGFFPRIATERNDSAESRLEKICSLVEACRFSIHDLSRAQASKKGEYYRLNMPFELGIDYGFRRYSGAGGNRKRILILEEKPYRYRIALSDLSGCDVENHGADFQVAIRKVRNWLVSEAGIAAVASTRIVTRYTDFQGWYYERQLQQGFSDEDIKDYPTKELMDAMMEWVEIGRPILAEEP
ncbi:MAG TPA: hypothetical protein VEA41_08370 [Salinarimonas sp.]|nr:hypothetical protein [Salinarimonas sp.]